MKYPTIYPDTRPSMLVGHQITPLEASRNDLNPKDEYIHDGDILDWILLKFGDKYDEAILVIFCESSFRRDAISPSSDYGLFQINQIHFSKIPGNTKEEKIEWILNPFNNIDFAYNLFLTKKWQPWFASFACHKLK